MLNDCWPVTADLVRRSIAKQVDRLKGAYPGGELATAAKIFEDMMTSDKFTEFLTLVAYDHID